MGGSARGESGLVDILWLLPALLSCPLASFGAKRVRYQSWWNCNCCVLSCHAKGEAEPAL